MTRDEGRQDGMTNETAKLCRDLDATIAEERSRDVTPCGDGGCILGHPGGMRTNGGCQHLKYHRDEHHRVIRNLADELRLARAAHASLDALYQERSVWGRRMEARAVAAEAAWTTLREAAAHLLSYPIGHGAGAQYRGALRLLRAAATPAPAPPAPPPPSERVRAAVHRPIVAAPRRALRDETRRRAKP